MVDVINPNITAGIGAQNAQINPLGMIGQFAAIQNHLLQAQLYKAKQAAGQLYTQSLGQDGQPDLGKYGALLASHPETSMYAAEGMNEAVQTRNLNADLVQKQLQNKRTQMEGLAGIYAGASTDPDVNSVGDFVKSGYASQMAELGIPHDELIAHLANPAPGSPASLTGDKLRSWYKIHSLALQHGVGATKTLEENYDSHMAWNSATGTWDGGWRNPYGRVQTVEGASAQPGLGGVLGAGPTQGAAALMGDQSQGAAAPAAGGGQPASQEQFGEPGPIEQKQLEALPSYIQGVNASQASAQTLNRQLDELDSMRKQFKSGAGTSTYIQAARMMQAAQLPQSWVDTVAKGSLPAGQTFDSIGLQVAVGMMKQQLLSRNESEGSAGRILQLEFDAYKNSKPNWDQDPRTVGALIGFMRRQNDISDKKAKALALVQEGMQNGRPLGGITRASQIMTKFEPYWTKKLYDANYITRGTADELGAQK